MIVFNISCAFMGTYKNEFSNKFTQTQGVTECEMWEKEKHF